VHAGHALSANITPVMQSHCKHLRTCADPASPTTPEPSHAACLGAALLFFAASAELRCGGQNGNWYKVEATLVWMMVHAGQHDTAPPALKVVSDKVLQYMVVMERSGRTVKIDDAHGNVSASMLMSGLFGQASSPFGASFEPDSKGLANASAVVVDESITEACTVLGLHSHRLFASAWLRPAGVPGHAGVPCLS
jgi:hypothetical protein